MLRHEYFQELCAAASVGQASAEELLELEKHAQECGECRGAYAEHLHFAGRQYSVSGREVELSREEEKECISSPLFERRFLDLARREGITFSPEVDREVRKETGPVIRFLPRLQWRFALALAAGLVIVACIPSAFYLGESKSIRSSPAVAVRQTTDQSDPRLQALNQRVAELTTANAELNWQIETITSRLQRVSEELIAKDAILQKDTQQRERLLSDRDYLQIQLTGAQSRFASSQGQISAAQEEIAKLRNTAEDANASLVEARMKVDQLANELKTKSEAFNQERQLLALGHDVSDLMGARNLHIVDVVDTDPRGRNRPAFGRIFFTEGKSLVFYAYDLNEARIEKAGYQYRVWAKKEGGDRQVRSLGIFYSDDKTQRRWVYKCNDPKILSEIDSVFVTLEPANADAAHPKGPNLMYAYLRGQPNHP